MALKGILKKKEDTGAEQDVFSAEFTNGTMEQLKELAKFLETKGFDLPKKEEDRMKEVIRIGIAWLEGLRSEAKIENSSE